MSLIGLKSVCGWCVGFGMDSGECLGDVVEKNMMHQVCYAVCSVIDPVLKCVRFYVYGH